MRFEDVINFYDISQLLPYILICVSNAVVLLFASNKFLLALQQCGYHGNNYVKWFVSKQNVYKSRLMLLSLLGLLFFFVLNMCFEPILEENVTSYIGFIAYFLFLFVYIDTERNVNAKLPLKKTRRMIRLSVFYTLLLAALTFLLLFIGDAVKALTTDNVVFMLRYSAVCLAPILAPFVLYLAYSIIEPFEILNNKRYIRKTTALLANSDVIKIGITGSFAKTSVKNILSTLLSQKYRVLATPESYNTPLGISLAVRKLDSTHDIFIAEMGAKHIGDISDLASMVKPQYAVLTGVNNQHLESFVTEENIMNTKFELFEHLSSDGVGFFSSDNDGSVELFGRFGGEKYLAGTENKGNFIYADDIVLGEKGVTFSLKIKGEKAVKCSTTLLGKHNIGNICLAAAVAYKIGMKPAEIALGVNRVSAIKHRLELLPNNKDIVIIDDSYNSNPDGVDAALEVLGSFSGRKIVITPGMIELGKDEYLANFNFGKKLALITSVAIIVGKHNAEMLIEGMLESGFDRENIFFAKNLMKANEKLNEIVRAGDVVLFENDLPDTYQ